jgi:hydrogenase maturation protein HypF
MRVESPSRARRRALVRVTGTVQGVGFRPYIYRLAGELGLGGYVLNDAHGVLIEVSGARSSVEGFLDRLAAEAPALAAVEGVAVSELEPEPASDAPSFEIRASPRGECADAPVTPDSATCDQCLRELFDPADRRHRYPFINCTNCGPRFTIVRGIPYDRAYTTMAAFEMCAVCRQEYGAPGNRRFHAQPNACPACGPRVRLVDPSGSPVPLAGTLDPVHAAARALRAGAIVAVKGIGGFHLACRADEERAVTTLRARKHREDKPFALMAGSVEAALGLVSLDADELALLCSPARPIVLAPCVDGAPVAAAVAPGTSELGVMLPYSPLHHLLLADAGTTLVMTSGNLSDEPIAYGDEDALVRLASLADLFLLHDRPIETRTDDSVVRVVGTAGRRATTIIRRSRGYVPASLPLPGGAAVPLLACGAELKNTFCLAKGERAWVGHHIGDLENYETLRSFADGIEHFQRLFAVDPRVVAHDLHPEYLSTKYAQDYPDVRLVGVQHHHAHLAACLAEHAATGPAVGAIFDGTGYGTDGTVWGGEILFGDRADFARVGHLRAVRMPGGERAIREPWRMTCAWLAASQGADIPAVPSPLSEQVDERSWIQVAGLARSGLASPVTTSIGRLFDAVAALCGIRATVNYEGQAAIELERACDPSERGAYPIAVDGDLEIDPRETIRAVLRDVRGGVATGTIAARFHAAVATATVEACIRAASHGATELVVLSGGVFQNRRLLRSVADGLSRRGLRVLIPQRLPSGDGGISYGQATVAAQLLALEAAR